MKKLLFIFMSVIVALSSFAQTGNEKFGTYAGTTLSGDYTTCVGYEAARYATSTNQSVYVGTAAGKSSSGGQNVFLGAYAGYSNTSGANNVFLGRKSGDANTTGEKNISIGTGAGLYNRTGSNNVFIGFQAGKGGSYYQNSYSGNIFIGYQAGLDELGSNKLYIENSSSSTPLIYGEFNNDLVRINGEAEITDKLEIGPKAPTTFSPYYNDYLLSVYGTGIFREVVVTELNWADFVFADDYELMSLYDLEKFIDEKNHLPDVPSEQEVVENGISLGEMDAILLQKIEELTLYVIELKKENDEMKKIIQTLK